MNISGIRPFEAIGYYSNVNRVNGQEAVAAKVQVTEQQPKEQPKQQQVFERPQQKETAVEFAKKYDPNAKYDLKGADSDINSLDKVTELPKAHKDEALKQYQTFVGGRTKAPVQPEKTTAPKVELENFNL
ncbi:MAG: hypothetical protein E7280_02765 [Lachnospiraceae bacterium]|jgi:hypothetical protein|nr:hypothetical protein [Lachnospiraceae bacterium]